ncbi:hypothetical protein [Teredinibacter haidensis]|uniref:hypothetical protein n=1 Tax=Teredinibacter haidensis TaxID=2731755 RepID=UPI000948CFA2|nr:hypothetical protein [Teredinibacter haidensis]
MNEEKEVYSVPRFLSFIDLAYLYEGLKVVDQHFQCEIDKAEDKDKIGNLNATCQSLYRSAFISLCSTLEQNLDELAHMAKEKQEASLSPGDLKDRGIKRSVSYANKVLGFSIDINQKHWKDTYVLYDLRNHLVHYGPVFSGSNKHLNLYNRLKNSEYVSFKSIPVFTLDHIEKIINTFMLCIDDFGGRRGNA